MHVFVWMDEDYSNLLKILPATDHAVAKDLTKPWCPANKQFFSGASLFIEPFAMENHYFENSFNIYWLVASTMFYFPFHILRVIFLIDFHIVQDG